MLRAKPLICLLLTLAAGWAADSPLESKAKIVALIFVSSECPISNKMAPEIERLHRKFVTNDVSLTVVYPNESDSDESVLKHRREYKLTGPFQRDPNHEIVKRAGATVTPEAVVFDEKRTVIYQGRINDQFLALGKGRPRPTRHDFEEALEAAIAGRKPKAPRTEAVGCFIQAR